LKVKGPKTYLTLNFILQFSSPINDNEILTQNIRGSIKIYHYPSLCVPCWFRSSMHLTTPSSSSDNNTVHISTNNLWEKHYVAEITQKTTKNHSNYTFMNIE